MKTPTFLYITIPIVVILMLFVPCIILSQETVDKQGTIEDKNPIQTQNTDETQDIKSQLDELKTTLYCYCGCDRMTYEICHCATAELVKSEFRNALESGKTVDEIRTAYLELHGPQYSAVMPVEGINILAYTMPAIILLAIGGVAFVTLRKSRKNIPVRTQMENQVSDELQKRVESELAQYKEQK